MCEPVDCFDALRSLDLLAIIHWGKTNLKTRPCLLSSSDFFESIQGAVGATTQAVAQATALAYNAKSFGKI